MSTARERALNALRHTPPEELRNGDKISVAWEQGDIRATRTGKVASIETVNNVTEYRTADAYLLVESHPDGSLVPREATITLVERHRGTPPENMPLPVFSLVELSLTGL